MRTGGVLIVAALLFSGCQNDSGGSSVATDVGDVETTLATASDAAVNEPSDAAQAVINRASAAANAIANGFDGDEESALAAVLLARDAGFSPDQILIAGASGRLLGDGGIVDPFGAPAAPEGPPTEVLFDDRTGPDIEPVGLRARAEPVPLSTFLDASADDGGAGVGGLTLVLLAFDTGYSLEEIVLNVLAGSEVSFPGLGDGDDGPRLMFLDPNGQPAHPGSTATPDTTSPAPTTSAGTDPTTTPAPTTTVTTSTTAPPTTIADQAGGQLDDLLARAQGVYRVGADLTAALPEGYEGGGFTSVDVVVHEGEMVIEQTTISGAASWTITTTQPSDPGPLVTSVTVDYTIPSTELTAIDNLLTFSGVHLKALYYDGEHHATWELPVSGYVDVDARQVVVTGIEVSHLTDTIIFGAV